MQDKDETNEADGGSKRPVAATLLDFVHCDFTITPLQAQGAPFEQIWRKYDMEYNIAGEHRLYPISTRIFMI